MQKNNRSDRKHGTFRKYGLPPIDTPEETSAIPFKKMKPKNEAYNIPRIGRSGSSIKQKPTTGKTDLRILWGEHNHTGTQPLQLFPEKEDYTTGKTERHPLGEKQTIEADCQSGGEISDYLSTALKGWGIWVSNRLPGK